MSDVTPKQIVEPKPVSNGTAYPLMIQRFVEREEGEPDEVYYKLHLVANELNTTVEVGKVQQSVSGTWCVYFREIDGEVPFSMADLMASLGPVFEI